MSDDCFDQMRTNISTFLGGDDWRIITAERNRQEALRDGRLRIGGPGDWYESIRWTWQAWDAIRPLEQQFARWPR